MKPSRETQEYAEWRASTPRWKESSVQRWDRQVADDAMVARMRRQSGGLDTGRSSESARYKSWRADNPRCFGTAVDQALRDEATAKHKRRVQTARASLKTTHDSRTAEYGAFRARLRENRLAKTAGLSSKKGQQVLEPPPWRPNSAKPKGLPSSAPAQKRGGAAAPSKAWEAPPPDNGRLAAVINQAGLAPDDTQSMAALANMMAADQRQLNGADAGLAEGAKEHVDAVREQQRLYMEAMEAGATAEEAEAAARGLYAEDSSYVNGAAAAAAAPEPAAASVRQQPVASEDKVWTGATCVAYTASEHDHTELKAYGSPPPTVKMVMEAVCVVLGLEPTWAQAKKLLGKSGLAGSTLSNLQVGSISKATLRKLKKSYIGKPSLDIDTAMRTSKAVLPMCVWVNNVYRAATGQEQLLAPAPAPVKRRVAKKRPASTGAGSRGSSPMSATDAGVGSSKPKAKAKPAAKKSSKKGKRGGARAYNGMANGGIIDPNDLVGTVSAAVQNGLSGDELLRLCESLGSSGPLGTASDREVRTAHQLPRISEQMSLSDNRTAV